MAKITGVNKRSVILDPYCGIALFLVRAMTQALDDCMLIHSDGNSNIRQGSCFDLIEFYSAE